jgi:hypothetical protein|tara:strand:+ start:1279 stop:2571 length:1293 start_codon:yes stop_codon:yes gene_type:complete
MLLVYTQKITPRITYAFRHICTRILGLETQFTSTIEAFVAHSGAKLSYGKQPLSSEMFIHSQGLLTQQGFESTDIVIKVWEDTKCFFSSISNSAVPFDIFSASFYLMSRYEEYLPHVKDTIGRYPYTQSLAHREGFLKQPVVDMWAYKFKVILLDSFPDLVFPIKKMTIHNVIDASQPFAFVQRGFLRAVMGFGSDLWKMKMRSIITRGQVLMTLRKDPYNTFNWIINTAKRSVSKHTFFFRLGDSSNYKEGINTKRMKFKLLVKFISDYKEVGLIFSSDRLVDYEKVKKEKERMEDITNRILRSSMNAHYIVNLPAIYRNLVELEVEEDFTMVYENKVGFRAGTCTPFLFYDLDSETKTPLIIHPLAFTTSAFEKKYDSEINKTCNMLYDAVDQVNGTFSVVFSNRDFTSSEKNKTWRSIFSEKLQIHG